MKACKSIKKIYGKTFKEIGLIFFRANEKKIIILKLKKSTLNKSKIILIASTLLIALLTNCVENEIVKDAKVFETSEISFSSNKQNISLVSQTIGITGFANGMMAQNDEFIFTLNAEQSLLNGRYFDFNNTLITIKKIGFKKYEVNAKLNGIGLVKLSSDLLKKSMSLKINEITFVEEELNFLKNENHIALITMTSILNEILFDNPSPNLNGVNARIKCAYYGYTLGWGWTQEQSGDHESCVRDGLCESIADNSCVYLGTSMTCLIGAITCVTISTFVCDDGVSC